MLTSDRFPAQRVEIAIIGVDVMGAMLAERLTSDGRTVLLLDRRRPAQGSTTASTALVMWGGRCSANASCTANR